MPGPARLLAVDPIGVDDPRVGGQRPGSLRQRLWKGERGVVLAASECRWRSAASAPDLGTGGPSQEDCVLRNILIIVYLAAGVFIASSHHYFVHLNSLTAVLSALPAVLLWPLILVGVNLHIK